MACSEDTIFGLPVENLVAALKRENYFCIEFLWRSIHNYYGKETKGKEDSQSEEVKETQIFSPPPIADRKPPLGGFLFMC